MPYKYTPLTEAQILERLEELDDTYPAPQRAAAHFRLGNFKVSIEGPFGHNGQTLDEEYRDSDELHDLLKFLAGTISDRRERGR